jgi:nitrilase
MSSVKAAAVQISPVLYSREGTAAKVVAKILELGGQGVQYLPRNCHPVLPLFLLCATAFRDGRGKSQTA